MEKGDALVAIAVGAKEVIEKVSDFFQVSISKDYYTALDKLTFLNCEMLGLDKVGNISDSAKIIGEAVCNISNLIVWGIILFYLFLSLFGYFLSKKVEIPWKMFIRNVVVGVLINSSFFICFSGVYFTENITEYLISYCGGETSFSYFEKVSSDLEIHIDEENVVEEILIMDNLMKITTYVLIFVLSIVVGIRFIILRGIIIFSPIFFAFCCSKTSEKIFFFGVKLFLKLLVYQIIMVVILEIFQKTNLIGDAILQILLISTMLIGIKFVKKMC